MNHAIILGVGAFLACNRTTTDEEQNFLQKFLEQFHNKRVRVRPSGCLTLGQMANTNIVKDKTCCPWNYKREHDRTRIPEILLNATLKDCRIRSHCINFQDRRSLSLNSNGICVPITSSQLILRKMPCDNGNYRLIPEMVTLFTGFTCSYSSATRIHPYMYLHE